MIETDEKNVNVVKEKIEIEQNKELQIKKEKNIRIYPIYRVFAWDLLFYYAIIYLFLTIEKGLNAAQVLQFDAFYILFKFIVQIPCTILIQKIGKRKSLVIANFILMLHILVIILAPNFEVLLISQVMCAFSYIIKSICESDMLYDSIERGEKRGIIFAKIDGKANSRYYYIEAISAMLSGFLFVVNPYLPMILCFIILLIAFLMSIKFEEIHEKPQKTYIKDEFKNIKVSLRNILKSKRLKSLLIFNATFIALIKILQNLRNTILVDIGMPEQYFGIIFAIMGIISGIAARAQGIIHKKYKNRTLAFLSIPTAISCLLLGIVLVCNIKSNIIVPIVIVLFAIQYIMKGPYSVLIKQYFNNFTTSQTRVKISTINNLCESLIASIMVFLASYILEFIQIQYTLIIIGCIFIISIVLLLDYMRDTVGLKMEEYEKGEIIK